MWPRWPRLKPDASRRHLQAAPVGQPAYSQFITQAASARGWFFANIAEPATKRPITRVSTTIFVMSPHPRRELPESRGNIDAAQGGSERSRGRECGMISRASLTADCRAAPRLTWVAPAMTKRMAARAVLQNSHRTSRTDMSSRGELACPSLSAPATRPTGTGSSKVRWQSCKATTETVRNKSHTTNPKCRG
jgi:hypothetical protein